MDNHADFSLQLDTDLAVDPAQLESRYLKDPTFLQEMLDRFQGTSRDCLLAMKTAIEEQSPIGLSRSAHKLKGSILNYVKSPLTECLQAIESDSATKNQLTIGLAELGVIEGQVTQLTEELYQICRSWTDAAEPK